MDIAVNRLTNCNVYIDGVNLLGRAEEVTIPKPKHKYTDHKGLGMAGSVKLWAGIDVVQAKIKWASIYPEVEAVINTPFEALQMQVRGSINQYEGGALVAEVPFVYMMTATTEDGGEMAFKMHENVDTTSTFSLVHHELYIDGDQMFLYDVMSNTYIVDGDDQLANFRANLGG